MYKKIDNIPVLYTVGLYATFWNMDCFGQLRAVRQKKIELGWHLIIVTGIKNSMDFLVSFLSDFYLEKKKGGVTSWSLCLYWRGEQSMLNGFRPTDTNNEPPPRQKVSFRKRGNWPLESFYHLVFLFFVLWNPALSLVHTREAWIDQKRWRKDQTAGPEINEDVFHVTGKVLLITFCGWLWWTLFMQH